MDIINIKIPNNSLKYHLQSFNEKETKTYQKKYYGEYKPLSPPLQMTVYGQWADSFL